MIPAIFTLPDGQNGPELGALLSALIVLFAASLVIGFIGSLLWRKAPSRAGRLIGATALAPAAAGFSALLFHAGMLLMDLAEQLVGFGRPTVEAGLVEWLRYSLIAALLPFVVSAVLVVIVAVITEVGPDVVMTHYLSGDEADMFLTGSSCSDALGCVTLGIILLGPLPYGLMFGVSSFASANLARLTGMSLGFLPDALALTVMLLLVWAGSLPSAFRLRPKI
jgi:hypothetical protein